MTDREKKQREVIGKVWIDGVSAGQGLSNHSQETITDQAISELSKLDATSKDDDDCVSTCQEVAILRKQLAVKVDEGKIEEIADILYSMNNNSKKSSYLQAKSIVKAIEE